VMAWEESGDLRAVQGARGRNRSDIAECQDSLQIKSLPGGCRQTKVRPLPLPASRNASPHLGEADLILQPQIEVVDGCEGAPLLRQARRQAAIGGVGRQRGGLQGGGGEGLGDASRDVSAGGAYC
jgi:hypothetical protein